MEKGNLIFIHKLLKAVADSIIIVFIPLYILKETNDIRLSMGYLVLYSVFVMLFMFVSKKLIQKYAVIAIILHFLPIIGTEAILSFAGVSVTTVIISAALMGLQQALYSVPLNLIFTFGDKKNNVGRFMIATNIGKLVFTLISGFILSSEIKNSFLILSIASAIFYIASVFPVIFAYKELKNNYDALKGEEKGERKKVNSWFILFHVSFGLFQPVMDNVVPLYLYINQLDFKTVTVFIVLVEFLKIVANTVSQILVKKNKSIPLVITGFILFMGSIVSIFFVKNSVALYILSCTASVSFPLTFVPMFGLYCSYLKETNNVFSGITRRDFDIFSLRPAMYALAYTPLGLLASMIVGAVACPFMFFSEIRLLGRKKEENNI